MPDNDVREESPMNSAIRSFPREISRSILRVSTMTLFICLVSGPATARADDIVLRWNEIAAQTATPTNPFNQARIGAIVQLAVFEAVNAVTGKYEPCLNPATVAPAGTSVSVHLGVSEESSTHYLGSGQSARQSVSKSAPRGVSDRNGVEPLPGAALRHQG
jgi:hypothetical protein